AHLLAARVRGEDAQAAERRRDAVDRLAGRGLRRAGLGNRARRRRGRTARYRAFCSGNPCWLHCSTYS
ncbi:hypothetical protein LCGC14_0897810, partial [marine sediment metagenome]